jgi:hypothetical protein
VSKYGDQISAAYRQLDLHFAFIPDLPCSLNSAASTRVWTSTTTKIILPVLKSEALPSVCQEYLTVAKGIYAYSVILSEVNNCHFCEEDEMSLRMDGR